MKNICIIFLLSIIISLTALGFGGVFENEGGRYASTEQTSAVNSDYLRIHIRADSNENAAQAVKYKVRDRIVEYLTPLVANYETRAEAMQGVKAHLDKIAVVAAQVLKEEGFSYGASADLQVETFPTRVYGEYTLPAGEYLALIIRLGSGEGIIGGVWYTRRCALRPRTPTSYIRVKSKRLLTNGQGRYAMNHKN